MKTILTSASLLAIIASGAQAAGVERSTQSVSILFEKGRYAEFSLGYVSPDVSGTFTSPLGSVGSSDIASSYTNLSFGYKMDIGDNIDFALVLDQPIGADINYPTGTGYPLAGTSAELPAYAVTGLVRYKFDNNVSLIGGLRLQSAKGTVQVIAPGLGLANYQLSTSREYDLGYVVGVAWERPDIAARVALTYNSAITHDLSSTETGLAAVPINGSFETEVPQSLNLEFQTGVAKDTLVFGSIRWVDWTAFDISPPAYTAAVGSPIASYDSNQTTFNLGVGRRFNETWSGALSVSYEKSNGDRTGNLQPTDGLFSVGVAGTYTTGPVKITGGVRYFDIGDATVRPPLNSSFAGNHGWGAGIRVAYQF